MPPVSVIIPFYNETPFIEMALNSVVAQGIAGAEILLVNDNPDQFPPDFFARFEQRPGVRVLHHEQNAGLSAARNTALAQARGTHIAFLDADDYYIADGLAAQLKYAQETRADITHAQCYLSHVGSPQVKVLPRDRRLFDKPKLRKGLLRLEEAQFITSSWSSVYRRDFLLKNNLLFDPEQRKFEDRLFVLHTITKARLMAVLGAPTRVWRRRAGSISSSATDAQTHLLQVQLLEKCMAHMRGFDQQNGVPPRFLKRELFNTLSRLIWDMDILPHLGTGASPIYQELGARIQNVLANDRLGQPIFSDPMVQAIGRVGMQTRKGVISQGTFFSLARMLREGEFRSVHDRLSATAEAVRVQKEIGERPKLAAAKLRRKTELILHLGMHKTGSTALQHALREQAEPLREQGVLFPETGLPGEEFQPTRPGGLPGHQKLLGALRRGDDAIWSDLRREIQGAGCGQVILSCENFLLPFDEDRELLLGRLAKQLAMFDRVRPMAFIRRADAGVEALYREIVCLGHRGGSRAIDEFLVDYGERLTDLPGLFAPFEVMADGRVILLDYDAARQNGGVLSAFCRAAGLPDAVDEVLGRSQNARYVTPDRDQVRGARLINTTLTSGTRRANALRGYFRILAQADMARQTGDMALLTPEQQVALLRQMQAQSADWAGRRGYAPDVDAQIRSVLETAQDWRPPTGISAQLQEAVIQSCLYSESEGGGHRPVLNGETKSTTPPKPAKPTQGSRSDGVLFQVRLRPWVRNLLSGRQR